MSSSENIHDAIKSSNPFSIKFVDQHHIWGVSFPDVPAINSHISNAVFSAIDQVSKNELPSIGIIITGEKGLGKTQIISRIRHRLQSEGNAFFIYMGNYGDLSSIKSEFLQTLTSSLKRIGVEGVTQWQELAANMVFTALGKRPCSAKDLADRVFVEKVTQNPKVPENWANSICSKNLELNNPYLVKAILWTLSANHSPYAISWLAGQELTQAKADELELPNNSQKNELATFKTTCELLALIANYSNLVFCFDELDDPNYNDHGFTRAQVVAALAKDLRNSISKCVLLLAMYPATLRDEIKLGQTQGASYDRTADKVLELDYLNSDTSVALVIKWLADFYASKKLIPPHPLYPFDEFEIREIGKEKPTARAILKWCSENWKVTDAASVVMPLPSGEEKKLELEKFNPVKDAYENALQVVEESIDEVMEDNAAVGFSLFCAFCSLLTLDENIEGVTIIGVNLIDDTTRSADKGYLHFRITAEENGKTIKIGVAAILNATGRFVGAALKRLIDYKKFDFTRGCLVRSYQIAKTAAVPQECVRKLLKEQGGEWVVLLEQDIKPLVAIGLISGKLEDYDLTIEQLWEFLAENRIVIDNPLIRDILRDPSGQEPSDLIDDELPISIPKCIPDADIKDMSL